MGDYDMSIVKYIDKDGDTVGYLTQQRGLSVRRARAVYFHNADVARDEAEMAPIDLRFEIESV